MRITFACGSLFADCSSKFEASKYFQVAIPHQNKPIQRQHYLSHFSLVVWWWFCFSNFSTVQALSVMMNTRIKQQAKG